MWFNWLSRLCHFMPWSFARIHILKLLIIFAGLFHGHLPSYRQVKTSIALCSAIFDRKGKNYGYFRQLWLISASILPASNQTQRWNSVVSTFIWMNYSMYLIVHWERERERERESEREMTVVYLPACCICTSLSTNNYFKNSDSITSLLGNIM